MLRLLRSRSYRHRIATLTVPCSKRVGTNCLNSTLQHCDLVPTNKPHYTIPPEWYYNSKHFELEQKQIFDNSWLLAGHRNALLPTIGSTAEVNISGESIVFVRNSDIADGEWSISAYYNVCPHRAHELVPRGTRKQLKSKVLTCPNHGWSFKATDGELIKARFSENVTDFCAKINCLKKVAIKEVKGLIFVNLNDDAEKMSSLDSVLGHNFGDLLSDKVPFIDSKDMHQLAVEEATINANWKVLVDNFLECYHCDIAHKAFVDMVDLNHYTTYLDEHRIMFESTCKPDNIAYKFSEEDLLQKAFFCYIWPYNVVYSAPGSPNMSILQFIPLTPTTTYRRSERFAILNSGFTGSSSTEDTVAQDRVEYLNKVLLEEDTHICESVQRGLQSKAFKGGQLMVSKGGCTAQKWHTEIAVARFHQLVRQYCVPGDQ